MLRVTIMTDDIEKGKRKQTEGKIREEVGKLTGDKSERIKGKMEQVEGKVQEDIGKVKKKI
jgi:uncharacterized protein YjbJ (UPF0337 family)